MPTLTPANPLFSVLNYLITAHELLSDSVSLHPPPSPKPRFMNRIPCDQIRKWNPAKQESADLKPYRLRILNDRRTEQIGRNVQELTTFHGHPDQVSRSGRAGRRGASYATYPTLSTLSTGCRFSYQVRLYQCASDNMLMGPDPVLCPRKSRPFPTICLVFHFRH